MAGRGVVSVAMWYRCPLSDRSDSETVHSDAYLLKDKPVIVFELVVVSRELGRTVDNIPGRSTYQMFW